MRRLIAICVVGLIFTLCTPVVNASISYGTPSPSLSPIFGTLVNFDDKAVGTPVLANDYVYLGVTSIVELEGLGFFGRYNSTQSAPCYVGTGSNGERGSGGIPSGWDGTIQIDLALPASMVGIGIANSMGGSETLSVYDSGGSLLESHTAVAGANVYAVITRSAYDISRFVISGDFFAIDDLQFDAIPAPGAILLSSVGVGIVGWLKRRRAF